VIDMAKFYGPIGYAIPEQIKPGIWKDKIVERNSSGDVLRNSSGWSTKADSTNDDLTINNQISIISDPFAYQHAHSMKYVVFMGTRWKIKNVDVQYPRLILTVGGVYNGKQA
jgi:hypothetical protein